MENEKKEVNILKQISNFLKNKCVWIEGILLISTICAMGYSIYSTSERLNVNKNIEEKQAQYHELESKYETSQKKVSERDKKIAELEQEDKQKEIENNIKALEAKATELENKKQTLESEINTLNQSVIRLKGQPKTYPAGHLTAGIDTPVGKYKIFGGSSNFFVYSSSGRLEVNIILGNRYGVEEYIYTFKSGDKIEANSSFKLVEVE